MDIYVVMMGDAVVTSFLSQYRAQEYVKNNSQLSVQMVEVQDAQSYPYKG